MNGLGKPFRKKSDPKIRKNCKNQSEMAACDRKTTSEKANLIKKLIKRIKRIDLKKLEVTISELGKSISKKNQIKNEKKTEN